MTHARRIAARDIAVRIIEAETGLRACVRLDRDAAVWRVMVNTEEGWSPVCSAHTLADLPRSAELYAAGLVT